MACFMLYCQSVNCPPDSYVKPHDDGALEGCLGRDEVKSGPWDKCPQSMRYGMAHILSPSSSHIGGGRVTSQAWDGVRQLSKSQEDKHAVNWILGFQVLQL